MGVEVTLPRRLALFLDGTWNDTGDNTNVWRLRSLCAPVGSDGATQLVYYDAGLGTQFGDRIGGGLFGVGIDLNVRKAYEWLVENYEDGDSIFIFGFSRGAFTARSLAGLLSVCGLVRAGTPLGVGQLYVRYQHVDRNANSIRTLIKAQREGKAAATREDQWLLNYSRPVDITMIGVWDTVAALDLPGMSQHEFLDPYLRHDVKNAFQALAIDENRKKFAPTLWTQSSPKSEGPPKITRDFSSVEQRWFIGAHANVGGGYPSDLLPQIPLLWMMGKAAALGLTLRGQVMVEPGSERDPIADSYAAFLAGAYKFVAARYFRPVGAPISVVDDYYVATINETIDASVFERWRSDPNYRPENLKKWADQLGVDPAALHIEARADDPALPLKRG